MREILFRGKEHKSTFNKFSPKWEYFSLFDVLTGKYKFPEFIDHATICQFTGLCDKNGTKIFEGDIFTLGDPKILYVVGWDCSAYIGNQIGTSSSVGLSYWQTKIEVIGNIHDNPELLESSPC